MDPDSDIDSSESNMKSCSSDSHLNTATDSSKSMLSSHVSENEKWSSNSESCASRKDTGDLSDSHEEMNIDKQVTFSSPDERGSWDCRDEKNPKSLKNIFSSKRSVLKSAT